MPMVGPHQLREKCPGGICGAGWRRVAVHLAWVVPALGLAVLIFAHRHEVLQAIGSALQSLQADKVGLAPVFMLINIVAIILLVPSAFFMLIAGAVYGLGPGMAISFVGTFIGQCAAFLLGRTLFRKQLAGWLHKRFPTWPAIEAALFQDKSLVLLLRLSPMLPDSVMNYALAVTSIDLKIFAGATAGAMLPFTLFYTYTGSLSRDIVKTITGAGDDPSSGPVPSTTQQVLSAAISGILFLALMVYVSHSLKKALAKATQQQDAESGGDLAGESQPLLAASGQAN
eukprot:CAMPEP_0119107770 /NCGR_PEP_ID=MMETSP1180-20130426/11593_1 /TAXON_ID=3052 ORGANISM="Chlamydomonas cf sp, Strain CCMP681" /NCGR_SAMPLE_ID=MMETSP1180 /ASSEMBLY_ACC=CAM_ASM_000741 /LENGTH=284 /DNA_ID=CAMNT_0007093307 /DNA_START=256 /DNA_END=1110 /DNA_ORIENTATION=-